MEKHYDFTLIEKQMQQLWEQKQIYQFNKNAEGEIYSIDTPPPTVSGALHIGHLFSYTQAEMIARFRRMQGYNVFYPFGFDDNGLPTERLVEREEKIRANTMSRSDFIKMCQRTTKKYENDFTAFWKSLGFSVAWETEYQTINPDVQKISQELFLELVKIGKAYPKEAPVLWCNECQTSIAQAELDTSDISDIQSIPQTLGTHERCGTPVKMQSSRQWYIDILSERERFLKAADEINWCPPNMKNRYITWVENLKWDWCISRQRYFGVPFPVWYCSTCEKPHFADKNQLPINPLETEYNGACDCGCVIFTPESAVFDTWVTSSITPQINERLELKLTPMSMRTHAHEIIRTWTFYTIVRSLYHTGDIPWKDLMICGFVLAKKGEKFSKSKGNNELDPKILIATHSADVLRYWSAGAKLGTDTFFSPDELSIPKRFITKLWNAAKFSISHLQDFDPKQKPTLLPIDAWIIEKINETTAKATELLTIYEIGSARHEIDDFFWKDFCDNYIEIVKERLYKPDLHGFEERKSGQYALYYVLLNILKLYAIYIPHITEHIYQDFFRQYGKETSIHLTQWLKPTTIDTDIIVFGEKLKEIIYEMRKYKSAHQLSMVSEMEVLEIPTEKRFSAWFKQTESDIKACSRAKCIVYCIID